jgi:hypothetical protein
MRLYAPTLLLVACTAPNKDYVAANLAADLARTPADLSIMCTPNEGLCQGASASERCVAGQIVVDRHCPAGSTCLNGYCQPPPSSGTSQLGMRCDVLTGSPQQLECAAKLGLSCQPFWNDAQTRMTWYCDSDVGAGTAATPCTSGASCRSGFCGSNGHCFDACTSTFGCRMPAAPNCTSVTITVEGHMLTAMGCTPSP